MVQQFDTEIMSGGAGQHRSASKVTNPIARSTAYDFNVQLDHRQLEKQKRGVNSLFTESNPKAGIEGKECLNVKEHEILFQVVDRIQQTSKDPRLRVQSSLNGLFKTKALQEKLRALVGTDYEAMLKSAADNGSNIHDEAVEQAILSCINYVGVAITPQEMVVANTRQDSQGFAATRGGLQTIINTGGYAIRPGDRVEIGVDVAALRSMHSQTTYATFGSGTGIPHAKRLLATKPSSRTDTQVLESVVNTVIAEMVKQRSEAVGSTAQTGQNVVDGLLDFGYTFNAPGVICPDITTQFGGGTGDNPTVSVFDRTGVFEQYELSEEVLAPGAAAATDGSIYDPRAVNAALNKPLGTEHLSDVLHPQKGGALEDFNGLNRRILEDMSTDRKSIRSGTEIQQSFKNNFNNLDQNRLGQGGTLGAYKLSDQNVGGWKCIRGIDIPASGGLNLTWKALSPNRGGVHNVDTAYDEASGSLGRVVLKIRAQSKEEFQAKAKELLDEMDKEFKEMSENEVNKVAAGRYETGNDKRIQHPVYRMFMYRRTYVTYTDRTNGAGHPIFDPHMADGDRNTLWSNAAYPKTRGGEWCVRGPGAHAWSLNHADQWATDDPADIVRVYDVDRAVSEVAVTNYCVARGGALPAGFAIGGPRNAALTAEESACLVGPDGATAIAAQPGAATITGGYYHRPLNFTYGTGFVRQNQGLQTTAADANLSAEQPEGVLVRPRNAAEVNAQTATWGVTAECNNMPRAQFRGGPEDRSRYPQRTAAGLGGNANNDDLAIIQATTPAHMATGGYDNITYKPTAPLRIANAWRAQSDPEDLRGMHYGTDATQEPENQYAIAQREGELRTICMPNSEYRRSDGTPLAAGNAADTFHWYVTSMDDIACGNNTVRRNVGREPVVYLAWEDNVTVPVLKTSNGFSVDIANLESTSQLAAAPTHLARAVFAGPTDTGRYTAHMYSINDGPRIYKNRTESASHHVTAQPVLGVYRIVQTVQGGVHRQSTGSRFRLEMVGTDQLFGIETEGEHSMLNAISFTGRRPVETYTDLAMKVHDDNGDSIASALTTAGDIVNADTAYTAWRDSVAPSQQLLQLVDRNDNRMLRVAQTWSDVVAGIAPAAVGAYNSDEQAASGRATALVARKYVAFANYFGTLPTTLFSKGTHAREEKTIAGLEGVWDDTNGMEEPHVKFAHRGIINMRLAMERSNTFTSRATSIFGAPLPCADICDYVSLDAVRAQWPTRDVGDEIKFIPTGEAKFRHNGEWNDRIGGIGHILAQVLASDEEGRPKPRGPTEDFVREIVKETIQAVNNVDRAARQRTIGVALSGASPGQPFDICLTSAT